MRTAEVRLLWKNNRSMMYTMIKELTGVRHGKTAPGVHHVHLWYQFGDIVVLRERKTEHIIFVGVGWKQTSCRDEKQTVSVSDQTCLLTVP